FIQEEIEQSAFRYQQQVESRERMIVGVNVFHEADEEPIELHRLDPAAEQRQLERTARLRAERNAEAAAAALEHVREAARGTENNLAVLDRRGGGKRRYLKLARRVRQAPKPDVVYAHFLVPTGLIASRVDAPLVVTAHGRDVRNVGAIRGVGALTARVVASASAVIAVSEYLRHELEAKLGAARGKTHVIDMGVDLERFRDRPTKFHLEGPAFVCV